MRFWLSTSGFDFWSRGVEFSRGRAFGVRGTRTRTSSFGARPTGGPTTKACKVAPRFTLVSVGRLVAARDTGPESEVAAKVRAADGSFSWSFLCEPIAGFSSSEGTSLLSVRRQAVGPAAPLSRSMAYRTHSSRRATPTMAFFLCPVVAQQPLSRAAATVWSFSPAARPVR